MKYTLITGASRGIGKSMAYKFASEGHNLIINARRKELLDDIKKDIEEKYKTSVIVQPADLSKHDEVLSFYDNVKKYDVDVFINNAGFGDFSYVWNADIKKNLDMIDLNIKALTTLSILYVKDNMEKDATLINVSSGAGYFIMNFAVPYSATKFYVSAFTEGVANSIAQQGKKMRIKVLAPSATKSDFMDVAEKGGSIKADSKLPDEAFITSDQLAEYAYQLHESDKVVGIVNQENKFEIKDVLYPNGM